LPHAEWRDVLRGSAVLRGHHPRLFLRSMTLLIYDGPRG